MMGSLFLLRMQVKDLNFSKTQTLDFLQHVFYFNHMYWDNLKVTNVP